MEERLYDVLIIGAGPVGLYTGYYSGLRKLKTLVCDSLEHLGGQMFNLYPEKIVYDLPGYKSIKASEFIDALEEQLEAVKDYVEVRTNLKITGVTKREEKCFDVETTQGKMTVGAIILAMGNGSFMPIRLGLEQEEQLVNLKYFIHRIEDYSQKDVVIFGGGDSAIDWSLMLEKIAKSVTLVHRREQFRAKPANVDKLAKSSIRLLVPYLLEEAKIDDGYIKEISVRSVEGEVETLKADEIIVSFGTTISNEMIKTWDIERYKQRIYINQQSMTSVSGIFACGDVCGYEGRQIQIISGLAEGMMASASVYQYLYPEMANKPVR